jgi:chromosome segregation ATPase
MSEQATSREAGAAKGGEAELRAQITRQREEILRLRDLLVSKDAELGAARGRLAELDDRSQRLAGAAGRIESRLPGVGRLIGTALRMLQSQRR